MVTMLILALLPAFVGVSMAYTPDDTTVWMTATLTRYICPCDNIGNRNQQCCSSLDTMAGSSNSFVATSSDEFQLSELSAKNTFTTEQTSSSHPGYLNTTTVSY